MARSEGCVFEVMEECLTSGKCGMAKRGVCMCVKMAKRGVCMCVSFCHLKTIVQFDKHESVDKD